jgi:hypothetical protein
MAGFDHDVAQAAAELDRATAPLDSPVQLHAELARRVRAISAILERGPGGGQGQRPDWADLRLHLVAIAAQCRRGARDLKIETPGDAFERTCPF